MALHIPPNRFKASLQTGKKQVGFWLTMASPAATEIAAEAGFDWLLIDMEHSPNDLADVVHHLRASLRGTAEPMVRVPEAGATRVKRLLDAGVRSLMFPNIKSVGQAEEIVASTRYPPRGIRGVAGSTRGAWYGRAPNYLAEAEAEICVVLQIETAAALVQIKEIGAVDGVDAIFIGPNDLAADMGYLGNPGAPVMKEAIRRGLEDLNSVGVPAGMLEFNEGNALQLFQAGFDFIAVGGDGSLLAKQTTGLVNRFNSALGE
jgi:4-hydroxy-2-oxoheptanedioate aldolase